MKKAIFLIISFFLMSNYTNALTLECPSIASKEELITCNLNEDKYLGIKANYNIDEGLEYESFTINSPWKKYFSNENGFSIGNINNKEQLTSILKIKVSDKIETNKEYKLKLTDIEAVDTNYKHIKLDDISTTIKIVSNDNTLKSLEVVDHKLTPKFNSNITAYEIETYKDKITIKATPTDKNATIAGDIGEQKLSYGTNTFIINVKSAKGEIKNYHIYITKKVKALKKSSDFTLKSLTITPGEIEFKKNQFLYLVDVDYQIEDIEIKAIPNNDKAKVTIDKPDILELGENEITITVTAEDGTIGKYTIIVNKKDKPSNDATIKNLTIYGYLLDFKSDTYEYELKIGPDKKLDIEIEMNDDKATYKITGNNNLRNNSIINIQTEAEDKTIKNYKIKILKDKTQNSTSIFEYINIFYLSIFIALILIILIIKTISNKKLK